MVLKKQRTRVSQQNSTNKLTKKKNHPKDVIDTKQKKIIIAHEIKFARLLANNDKKVRDKVLKNLKKWLTFRSQSSFEFSENDYMRLWKGLFYCMWLSDKPLVQEELAESISHIVHCFQTFPNIVLYTKCALKTLATEWFGIDQYRMDKFEMLTRRILRQTFAICKSFFWDNELTEKIAEVIQERLLDKTCALGFSLHIEEIFWEEFAKISEGKASEDVTTTLIKPFLIYLAHMDDARQIRHVLRHIFRYLIFQSDVGLDYQEKFQAWRDAGFPCSSIHDMQKLEVDEDPLPENDLKDEVVDLNEIKVKKFFDPRAGRLNIELPQISFNPEEISKIIAEHKFLPYTTAQSRRQMTKLVNEFEEVTKGIMPLGVFHVKKSTAWKKTMTKDAVQRYLELENELSSDNGKALRGKKRRRKTENGESYELKDQLNDNKFEKKHKLCEENDEELSEPTKSKVIKKSKLLKNAEKKQKLKSLKKQKSNSSFGSWDVSDCNITDVSSKTNITETENVKESTNEIKTVEKNTKISNISEEVENCVNVQKKITEKKNILEKTEKYSKNIENVSKSLITKKTGKENITEKSVSTNPSERTEASDNQSKKKLKKDHKSQSIAKKLPHENTVVTNSQQVSTVPLNNSYTKKRVKIVLKHNTAQNTSEYIQQLRASPAIPFDANKKPLAGVLKQSPVCSPINPFYKR